MKEQIIETLGKHYSGKIIEYLNEKGIMNKNGKPYKNGSIQKIVNEERRNIEVETAIVELIAETIEKRLKNTRKIKRIKQKISLQQ